MRLCGTPDEGFMSRITSQEARNYIRTLPLMKKKNFKEELKKSNDHGTITCQSQCFLARYKFIFHLLPSFSCGFTGKNARAGL